MTKFGQAEYIDFMAKMFADKISNVLEESEKQNFECKNTEDIYMQHTVNTPEKQLKKGED